MRAIVISLLFLLSGPLLIAQALNDYRSVANGDWNTSTTWQIFNGTAWVAAATAPNPITAGIVTVQSANTVVFSSSTIVDRVVINGKVVVSSSSVTLTFPATPSPAVITINNGGSLDVTGGITQVSNTNIIVNSGGVLIARQGSSLAGSTTGNLSFANGATYQHNFTSTAGTIPLATWATTSTMLLTGTTSYTTAPGNLNQNFGNVSFDLSTGSLNLNGQLISVAGNLATLATNKKSISFGAAIYTITIGGDLIFDGTGAHVGGTGTSTTFNVLGSYNQLTPTFLLMSAGAGTLNVKKDFSHGNGTFGKSGGGTATINFNGAAQTFTNGTISPLGSGLNYFVISGSTLDLGTSQINGNSSTFTVNSGGTVKLGSTSTSGALIGNLPLTGTRTFLANSTIIYANVSNALQYMGTSGFPTALNANITTIINNTGSVRLVNSGTTTILGNLVLTAGGFDIGNKTVVLGGTLSSSSINGLIANGSTNLTINDAASSADFGLLSITGTSVIGSLTIDGLRTVRLGSDLAVFDPFTINKGDFQLNGFTLNLQGGIFQNGGTITSNGASGINISDEATVGPLPASLAIAGGNIGTITMNRASANLTISNPITATNLNLVLGSFTPGPSFQLAALGTITVTDGLLVNPVTAVSMYDVVYNGLDSISTGAELPTSSLILRNLINSNTAAVTLSANAVVNGALVLNSGRFYSYGNAVTLNGDVASNAISDFVTSAGPMGTVTFDGTTNVTGSVAPQFGNTIVNASKSINLNAQINIGGDFTMNGIMSPNTSTVLFNGNTVQNIQRSVPTGAVPFYQLEIFKKTGQVNILDSATVQAIVRIDTSNILNAGNNLLKLLSSASQTARVNPLPVGASITGSVIVQRYLPDGIGIRAYRYAATPVTNTFVSDWKNELPITGTFSDPSTGPGIISSSPSLFYYDETQKGTNTSLEERYIPYPSSGTSATAPLVNGRGYAIYDRNTGPVVYDSRGTLQQHQVVVPVTAQSTNGTFDGWNLIGNPYPSPIVWNKVSLSAGVESSIYITDNTALSGSGSGKITYIAGVGVPGSFDGTIDSHQGFWIHSTAPTGTVTFDESNKVIDADSLSQIYRTAPISNLLRITLANQNDKDEVAIRFLDGATDGFDVSYDALKFPDPGLSFTSQVPDGRELTINTLAALNCSRSVPLAVANVSEGNYAISGAGLGSFGSDVDLFIYDSVAGKSFDLRSAGSYNFTLGSSELASVRNRFVLQIGKTRILKDLPVLGTSVCFNDSVATVTIQNTQSELAYKAVLGGNDATAWMTGTGANLILSLPAKTLTVGKSSFTILLQNSCFSDTLQNIAIVTRLPLPVISRTIDGVACTTGTATVFAEGASVGQSYNWYKTATSSAPFLVTASGKLTIDVTQSAYFYVSASDSLGCESQRASVKVTAVDSIKISRAGNVLISSYPDGNTWSFNNVPISTAASVQVDKSGTYSVQVTIDGCTTQATATNVITAFEEKKPVCSIYPNPTKAKFVVYLQNYSAGVACIDVVSVSGVSLYSDCFAIESESVAWTIPSEDFSPGVYILRIRVNNETIIRKVIKE